MFSKKEFFGAIIVSFIGGMAIGYSKAREKCIEAIVAAVEMPVKEQNTENEEEA